MKKIATALTVGMLLVRILPTHADWFCDFDDGIVPEDFTTYAWDLDWVDPTNVSMDAAGGVLRVRDSDGLSPDNGGTKEVDWIGPEVFDGDVRVSAEINSGRDSNDMLGVVLDKPGSDPGYWAALNLLPGTGTSGMILGGKGGAWATWRDAGSVTDLNRSYFIEMELTDREAEFPLITVRVLDSENGDVLLEGDYRDLDYNDSPPYRPLQAGVIAFAYNFAPINASFDNIGAVDITGTELTWDALGDGTWGEIDQHGFSRWVEDGFRQSTGFPGTIDDAVVVANTVTVAQEQRVGSLAVYSGGIVIAEARTLTIDKEALFAPGSTLTMEADAVLEGDSATIHSLSTAADAAINNRGLMIVANYFDAGVPGTLTKQGTGTLQISNASTGSEHATFDVRQGRLLGLSPSSSFGRATLRLSGGEIVLMARDTDTQVPYDNPVVVESDAILTAGAVGVGAAGPVDVTLGSAANGVTLSNDAKLELRATDDYTLTIAGPVTGAGQLRLSQGNVTLARGADVTSARVAGGTLNTGSDLNVQEMLIESGTVNTNANQVNVGERLTLGDIEFTAAEGTTFSASSTADMLTEAALTFNGGTVAVAGRGATLGFGDGTGWTTNGSAASQDAGVPNLDMPDVLQLTTQVNEQTSGAFCNEPQNITRFFVEFDYQLNPPVGTPADGAVFVIQNDSRGVDALGDGGGSMGYRGIAESFALVFNIWWDHPISVSFAENGTWNDSQYEQISPIDLRSTHAIHTSLDYDGTTVTLELEDAVTGDTFHTTHDVDIPSLVGGDTAYLGFTGATGGANSNQTISSFGYAGPAGSRIAHQGLSIVATADTTLDMVCNNEAVFDDLTVEPGVALAIKNVDASFDDVTLGAGASVVIDELLVRGSLSTGGNPGEISIAGELEFDESAILRIDPSADMVRVAGDVFLAGTLALKPGSSMGDLSAGEWGETTRDIITTSGEEGAIVDTFENVPTDGRHLGSGVFFGGVTYDPDETSVGLSVFQAAPGDADGDREINNSDLQQILGANSFGNGTGFDWTQGDFDGDTDVDNADLQLILATGLFGTGAYAAVAPSISDGALTAVPEPGTLVMLTCSLLCLLAESWRRRKRG